LGNCIRALKHPASEKLGVAMGAATGWPRWLGDGASRKNEWLRCGKV